MRAESTPILRSTRDEHAALLRSVAILLAASEHVERAEGSALIAAAARRVRAIATALHRGVPALRDPERERARERALAALAADPHGPMR